ncbi:MAG TPA: hypothetical protein PLZ68_04405 [Ferruginibacter sp.]|nr:hypothetical protein [Ferruginibacter sp.]
MKLMLMLVPVSLVYFFSFTPQQTPPFQNIQYSVEHSDSSTKQWIEDFKIFRSAVYQNDKAKVGGFFTFPVMNPSDEIWFLVLSEKEREAKKLTNNITPFTKSDFNKYYKKLFPPAFIKTILKIKSAELFNKGETQSDPFKEGNTTHTMFASVDRETSILSLNLSYNTVWKDENGEITDGGESTVIYSFKITDNAHLQFMYVRLAG